MKISIAENHNQKANLRSVEIETIFEKIKTGGTQRDQILKIRDMVSSGAEKKAITDEKGKLPAIIFGGTFRERNKMGLIEASGLMILDFDGEAPNAKKLQDYIYAIFKSPSGKGFKVLIRIPVVKSDDEYKQYYSAIQQVVPEVDSSGADICRLCYFSFDEKIDVFDFNKVRVWTTKIEPKPRQFLNSKQRVVKTDYAPINNAIKMIRSAPIGERHQTALKSGRLIGGYIAGGSVDENDAKNIIHKIIEEHSPDDVYDHTKAFDDGIENGKKSPLSSKEIKEIEKEVERMVEIDLSVDEVRDEMMDRFKNGRPKGYKVGWKDLDNHYTLVLGKTTYLYSSAYSGKTQWWNEVLINLSRFYGMNHLLFSPETGNAAEIYEELCQIYCKKDFKDGVMTDLEREESMDFVNRYFLVLDGDFFEKDLSIYDLCDYAAIVEKKHNKKFHTLTIDPWNELQHHYTTRQDLELEKELKYVRMSAKNHDRHICLVTHVRDQDGQYDREMKATFYHLPTFRDVAGGQTWSRKGMMMIAVWRPIVFKTNNSDEVIIDGQTFKKNQLIIQIQKSKPKGYGSIGEINLYYQFSEHCYKDEYGRYAMNPENYAPIPEQTKTVNLIDTVKETEKEKFPF